MKNPEPILIDPKKVKEFQERFQEAVRPELEKQQREREKSWQYAKDHFIGKTR